MDIHAFVALILLIYLATTTAHKKLNQSLTGITFLKMNVRFCFKLNQADVQMEYQKHDEQRRIRAQDS